MESVKITAAKTWSSIDIFLFSNGQQYSPPRKYHLRAEDLQWWEATLGYIGRTQYGSGHSSIELYTIDGAKVNGPLELNNGSAYVAVLPPDSFIDTGYEEYLVRASRSWEKRLAQKTNISEIPKSENSSLKLSAIADETLTSENNGVDKNEMLQISNDKIKTTSKPQRLPHRKSTVSAKHIQKKKLSDTNNPIIKRICAETDKTYPCPRKSSLKRDDNNTNRRRLLISCPTNPCKNIGNQQQMICFKKPHIRKLAKAQDTKNNEVPEALPCSMNSYNNNSIIQPGSDYGKSQNKCSALPSEEQTVISLYKNKDVDLRSIVTDPDYDITDQGTNKDYISCNQNENNQIALEKSEQNIKNEYKLKQMNENYNLKENHSVQNEDMKCDENKNIKSNNETVECFSEEKLKNDSNINDTEDEVTDEYVAYMNKGGLLFLKFHIKVKDCKTIINRDKVGNIEQTTKFPNLHRSEKMSQVNIDINFSGEIMNSNEQEIRDKSLQLILDKLCYEKNDNENTRIIILQCACQKYSMPENVCKCREGEEIYSMVQKETLNRTFTCCECNNTQYRSSIDEKLSNVVVATRNDEIVVLENKGTRVKSLAQKFEGTDKLVLNERKDSVRSGKLSRHENYFLSTEARLRVPKLETNSELPVREEDNKSLFIYKCEKSTQTDWCNVLLEARRHENDTYTFHLPSLYVLKELMF